MELWRQESFPPVTPKKKSYRKKDKKMFWKQTKIFHFNFESTFWSILGPFWYFGNYKQVEFDIFPLDGVYDKYKTFKIFVKLLIHKSWKNDISSLAGVYDKCKNSQILC